MATQAAQRRAKFSVETEASDLEELVGYNLKRAYMIVNNDFRQTLGEDGLSSRVFAALSIAVRFKNITQSEMARMIGIERSGLVAIVDELQGRGFLERVAVPGDRRVQALVPTDEGMIAYSQALEAIKAHEDRLFEKFTDDERQTLLTLLKKIRRLEPISQS